MRIGIIGAGNIGGTLTRRLTELGHDVTVANSRGPASLMLLTREFFQTFTDLPLGDPATSPSVSTSVYLDSRDAVDAAAAAGLAAGGTEPRPASDYGFMYQRGLTDPDGNVIEFGWMDPVAVEQGPGAFMSQQA